MSFYPSVMSISRSANEYFGVNKTLGQLPFSLLYGKDAISTPSFFAKYRELIDIKWQSRRSFLFLFLFLFLWLLVVQFGFHFSVFLFFFFSFFLFLFPLQLRFCCFSSGSGSFEGDLSFFRLVIIALVDCA